MYKKPTHMTETKMIKDNCLYCKQFGVLILHWNMDENLNFYLNI